MSDQNSKIKTIIATDPKAEAEKTAKILSFNTGEALTVKEVTILNAWAITDWEDKLVALFIKDENISNLHK